jgi:uncharacterized delta-60 repeat protein
MTTFKTILSAVLLASLSANAGCGEVANDPPQSTPDAAEPAKLALAAATTKLPILQGTSVTVDVTVTRLEGITGAVVVAPVGLPDGVTADPLTIAADATTGTLTLHADAAAPHSLPTEVALRGTIGTEHGTTDVTVTVYGPPGSLDTSFAGGKLLLGAGAGDDYANAIAVQPDGKIIVAGRAAEHLGDFALIRLERDGQLDPTFGDGGRVLTDFFGAHEGIHAITLQPDGKIIAVGVSNVQGSGDDFAVARYLPDGSLDTTFGDQGKVTTTLGPDADTAYAVVLQPDGKIVVGGDSSRGSNTTGLDFALVRYEANGRVDRTWGNEGITLSPMRDGNARDTIYALAVQTIEGEARIVATGGEGDFSAARYRSDGTVDNTFNFDIGTLTNIFGSVIGAAHAIAITPTGEIAIAGQIEHNVAVVRLTSAGRLDESFNGTGTQITKVSTTNQNWGQALAVEPDGKLVVAGYVWEGASSSGNFAVLRYNTDGALDTTFGSTGIVVTPVAAGTKPDQANAVALQRDDRVPTLRIVTAGNASDTNSDFAIARYWR